MHDKAIFCKTFRDDFGALRQLLNSYERHAANYPMLLSMPKQDRALGAALPLPSGVTVINDEEYTPQDRTFDHGWIQQQLCKLSVWRAGFASSYLVVDSDAYFISEVDDSVFAENGMRKVVYSMLFTVAQPSNHGVKKYILDTLSADETYARPAEFTGSLEQFPQRLEIMLRNSSAVPSPSADTRRTWIDSLFDIRTSIQFQPGQIFHADLLERMCAFFAAYGLAPYDLVNTVPWEYNWYGAWVGAARPEGICGAISPILHFDSVESIRNFKECGITEARIASKFKLIQMAARHFDVTAY